MEGQERVAEENPTFTLPPELYGKIAKDLSTRDAIRLSQVDKNANLGVREELFGDDRLDKDASRAQQAHADALRTKSLVDREFARATAAPRHGGAGLINPNWTARPGSLWRNKFQLTQARADATARELATRLENMRYSSNLPYYKHQLRKGLESARLRSGLAADQRYDRTPYKSELVLRELEDLANRRRELLGSGMSEDEFYALWDAKKTEYFLRVRNDAKSRDATTRPPFDPGYSFPYESMDRRLRQAVGFTEAKRTPRYKGLLSAMLRDMRL
eukprot:jgi/Mesvir1/14793/Mv05433-RA.1